MIVLLCQVTNVDFSFGAIASCSVNHLSSVTCRLFFFSCFETMRNVMSQHSKYWGSLKIGGKWNSSISTVQVVSLSISSLLSFTYSVISPAKHILSTWFIVNMGILRHQCAGQWFFIKFKLSRYAGTLNVNCHHCMHPAQGRRCNVLALWRNALYSHTSLGFSKPCRTIID